MFSMLQISNERRERIERKKNSPYFGNVLLLYAQQAGKLTNVRTHGAHVTLEFEQQTINNPVHST